MKSTAAPYRSVFEQVFDAAVYGTGYAALAAAWTLCDEGRSVLLFGPGFGVAWESGQAFATRTGSGEAPLWSDWLDACASHGFYRNGCLDCAGAEWLAVQRLRHRRETLRVLLGASAVALRLEGGTATEVVVATKNGERRLHARRWMDTTDEAVLTRLALPAPERPYREPAAYEYRARVVRCRVDSIPPPDGTGLPEGIRVEPLPGKNQFLFCLRSDHRVPLRDVAERLLLARDALGPEASDCAIACFSFAALPVFAVTPAPSPGLAALPCGHLVPASPACTEEAVDTLADRFRIGVAAASRIDAPAGPAAAAGERNTLRRLPLLRRDCDVLVAGTGTGGAVAALAAADEGTRVLAIDLASSAGGIGTNGLINGYWKGQPGGLFEDLDRRSREIERTLVPHPVPISGERRQRTWNREAKKLAFEEMLAAHGNAEFIGDALAYGVTLEDGRIVVVRAATATAVLDIRPKAVADGTGDGDLAALAGAAFDTGRPGDGQSLCYSQSVLRVECDEEGRLNIGTTNFDAGWVDMDDPEDVTRARLTAVAQYTAEDLVRGGAIAFAPILGLRQSRHFHTIERITLDDLVRHRPRTNSIGYTLSATDTHMVDYEFEEDELLFWLWGCKNFRGEVYGEMPYGVLVPVGLRNLWLACRAAGVTPAAAYALRMERDIQRIGEAAGRAAALAVQADVDAPDVPLPTLQARLAASGALNPHGGEDDWAVDPLGKLDRGEPGGHLWTLYREPDRFAEAVLARLNDGEDPVSWLAAVLLAMWKEPAAEPRLIRAIETREPGVPTPPSARGAHGQYIDVPNGFLAVNLLRRCGSAACLSSLEDLARRPLNLLDLRASIALTLERIAPGLAGPAREKAGGILRALAADAPPDRVCRPSRSIARALRGAQQESGQDRANEEDNGWRLDLALCRASQALDLPAPAPSGPWPHDERAYVRKACPGSSQHKRPVKP